MSNPKFQITLAEMKEFFEFSKNTKGHYAEKEDYFHFLNAFFTNKAAKPLSQWNAIIHRIDFAGVEDANAPVILFIKRFGAELDLNFVESAEQNSLLEQALYDSYVLFDLLISNPKVRVNGMLEHVLRSHYYDDKFFKAFMAKRGREISQTEILQGLIDLSRGEAVAPRDLQYIKTLLPLVKSFNGFTALKTYNDAPILFFMKNHAADPDILIIYNRILKEDTTLVSNMRGVIMYLFTHSRFDLVNIYISKGYDINTDIDDRPILVKVTALRNLNALKYLAGLKITEKTPCATNWCRREETAFGIAMKMDWFEGADYLLTNMEANFYTSSGFDYPLTTAVKRKSMAAVEFLLSKGCDVNYTDALVESLMVEADDITRVLLARTGVNPNKSGYDDSGSLRVTYPIIEAARFGKTEFVKALLQLPGIDKNIKDGLGYRAIDWAATNGHQDIVQLLKNP